MTRKTKGTPDEIDAAVGDRLRVFRKDMGLSQTELGNKIGLTFQQIQKYERGLNRIAAGRLYKFSVIFGVSVDGFFPDTDSANIIDRQFREIDRLEMLIKGVARNLNEAVK